MSNSAPLEKRRVARSPSSRPLRPAPLTRRAVSAPQRPSEELLTPDHSGAGIGSSLPGAVGYVMHGFVLFLLSIWAFYHFGQVFWFFSIVIAAVGIISMYYAYAAWGRPRNPRLS